MVTASPAFFKTAATPLSAGKSFPSIALGKRLRSSHLVRIILMASRSRLYSVNIRFALFGGLVRAGLC
jgi:hypothetical protein